MSTRRKIARHKSDSFKNFWPLKATVSEPGKATKSVDQATPSACERCPSISRTWINVCLKSSRDFENSRQGSKRRCGGCRVDTASRRMSKRKTSPCVDVCKYLGPKGWCVACGLTSKESRSWRSMKPYDRNILLKNLQRRRTQMKSLNLSEEDA